MKIGCWLALVAVGAASCSLTQADPVEPGHYTNTLQDWDDDQVFNFTPNPTGVDTDDFTNPDSFCVGFDACFDPSVRFNAGGGSTPENGEFSFSTGDDAAGNTVVLDFSNTGAPITEVLLTLTSNGGQLNPDQSGVEFTCDGGGIFQQCGFNNDAFQVLFWDPVTDGIPTATTPEPAQWAILLPAFALLVGFGRKRLAN